jgi:hypothetical protein
MNSDQKKYHSYLLRLWQVKLGEGIGLRASLEDVQTGELQGFEDLAALLEYLKRQAFMDQEDKAVMDGESLYGCNSE